MTPHAKSNAREGDVVAENLLLQAIARGWCAPENAGKVTDPSLAFAIEKEVRAYLAAMQAQQGAEPVALRQAVADYIGSEGCSCCQGDEHDQHAKRLAELLDVPPYSDGSGYDFSLFRTGANR